MKAMCSLIAAIIIVLYTSFSAVCYLLGIVSATMPIITISIFMFIPIEFVACRTVSATIPTDSLASHITPMILFTWRLMIRV